MKKYIYSTMVALFGLMAFTACTEDNGTEPGSDGAPAVTVYTAALDADAAPDLSDNAAIVRLVANAATDEVYYLLEKTADKEARGLSEAAYADYVVENGQKATLQSDEFSGGKVAEVELNGILGNFALTAVAVKGSSRTPQTFALSGPEWTDVTTGTYYFANKYIRQVIGANSKAVTLQVDAQNPKAYRIKDLFGEGCSLKFNLMTVTGEDADGKYTLVRVPDQATTLDYGDYQSVYVRDIGYWQGNDAFATNANYMSQLYEDNTIWLCVQWRSTANKTASFGYGYDCFMAD